MSAPKFGRCGMVGLTGKCEKQGLLMASEPRTPQQPFSIDYYLCREHWDAAYQVLLDGIKQGEIPDTRSIYAKAGWNS